MRFLFAAGEIIDTTGIILYCFERVKKKHNILQNSGKSAWWHKLQQSMCMHNEVCSYSWPRAHWWTLTELNIETCFIQYS